MLWTILLSLLLISPLAAAKVDDGNATCTGLNAISPRCRSNEASYHRDFFYVGGRYVSIAGPPAGSILVGQIYVEKLTPANGVRHQQHPLVFFHGGGTSGVTWLQTPDNRKGWASYFIERGYQVYIVDVVSVGRSVQQDLVAYPLRGGFTIEGAEAGFTGGKRINAFPQSQLHTQWPGSGIKGDPTFDAFVASFLPLTLNFTGQELDMRASGCALLKHIGPSFLISHSIGALFPILLSDACPELVAGNVNLEPTTIPFQSYTGNATSIVGRTPNRVWGLTNTRITYDPSVSSPDELSKVTVGEDTPALRSCILQATPARRLPNIAKVPYVAITAEASPHITYDHCVINYLEQAGVRTDWIKLGEIGIHGNGHFAHLELNNLDIAAVVDLWISKQSRTSRL